MPDIERLQDDIYNLRGRVAELEKVREVSEHRTAALERQMDALTDPERGVLQKMFSKMDNIDRKLNRFLAIVTGIFMTLVALGGVVTFALTVTDGLKSLLG
jgi:hypothetical protein